MRPYMLRHCLVSLVIAFSLLAQEAPLRWVDGRMVMRTTLKAGEKVYECNLMVDLGIPDGLALHGNAAGTLRSPTAGVVSGDLTLSEVAIGRGDGGWLEAFTARWSEELREVPAAGFIGLGGLLSDPTRQIIVIDGPRGRIKVADRSAWPEPGPPGSSTFRLVKEDSGLKLVASAARDGEVLLAVSMKNRQNTIPRELNGEKGPDVSRVWRFGTAMIAQMAPWHPGAGPTLGASMFSRGTWWFDVAQGRAMVLPTSGASPDADEVAFAEALWTGDDALPEFYKAHKTSRWTEESAQKLLIDALRESPPDVDVASDRAVAWLGATPAGRRASAAAKLLERLPPDPLFDPFREAVIGLTLKDARADMDGTAQAKLRFERGEILRSRGDAKGAFRDLLSSAFGMPHDGRPQLALARLHEQQGEADRAKARYLRAIMDPEHTAIAAWTYLAEFDLKQGGSPKTFTARIAEELEGRIPEFHPLPPDAPASRPSRRPRGILVELFTGAQCPPCAAADLAVDGLDESWPKDEIIALAWHLPIPAPEPMVAACSDERAERAGVRGTPTFVIGGKRRFSGGGKPDQAQTVYEKVVKEVEGARAEDAPQRLRGHAARADDTISAEVTVEGPSEGLTFRAVLVEKLIAFPGKNAIVFHRQVARALLTGKADGAKYSASVSLKQVAKDLDERVSAVEEQGRFKIRPTEPNVDLLSVIVWIEDRNGVVLDALELPITSPSGR